MARHSVSYVSEHSAVVRCACSPQPFVGDNLAAAVGRYAEHIAASVNADLLDALRFVRDALDRHLANVGDYAALCEDLQDMDESVRAALAKAEGRCPGGKQ